MILVHGKKAKVMLKGAAIRICWGEGAEKVVVLKCRGDMKIRVVIGKNEILVTEDDLNACLGKNEDSY